VTHIPPPTEEQLAIVERLGASYSMNGSARDALAAVLAYARLGMGAARTMAAFAAKAQAHPRAYLWPPANPELKAIKAAADSLGLLPPTTKGMNHASDCPGAKWTHSGAGYNRVRVCECGAEDHAPEVPK